MKTSENGIWNVNVVYSHIQARKHIEKYKAHQWAIKKCDDVGQSFGSAAAAIFHFDPAPAPRKTIIATKEWNPVESEGRQKAYCNSNNFSLGAMSFF